MQSVNPYIGAPIPSQPAGSLTSACKINDLEQVRRAIAAGAKPDPTTLAWAVHSRNLEIVRLVQAVGAKPESSTMNSACSQGNPEIVKLVILAGGIPDSSTLDFAIDANNLEIVRLVQNLGAKASPETLKRACWTKNREIVCCALKARAKGDKEAFIAATDTNNGYPPEIVDAVAASLSPNTLDGAAFIGLLQNCFNNAVRLQSAFALLDQHKGALSPAIVKQICCTQRSVRERSALIQRVCRLGIRPDGEAILSYLISSQHHENNQRFISFERESLDAMESAGAHIASEKETNEILRVLGKQLAKGECHEPFFQFLVRIGFKPSETSLENLFLKQARTARTDYENHLKNNGKSSDASTVARGKVLKDQKEVHEADAALLIKLLQEKYGGYKLSV
jgi:hypothetical protein